MTEAPSKAVWMGEVPPHWDIRALKFCAELVTDRVDGADAGAATYIGLEHIESKTGRLVRAEGSQDSAESTVNCFQSGDVLFGKLRPYLAKATVAETNGVCSSEILVYRPHSLTAPYLRHVMLLSSFIEEVTSSTYGSKMPRADASFISRLPVPQPPIEEQIAIASYLDAETARIDGLLEEKTELLRLLGELKRSVIAEHLACDGEIWKVGHAFRLGSGTTPPSGEANWYGGETPWVQTSELREKVIRITEKTVSDAALQSFSALKVYPPGTLLVAMYGATIGRLGLLEIPATCNQACCALVPDGSITSQFLFWWLYANKDELLLRASGGTQPNISSNVIANLRIRAPSVEEQRRRVESIDRETERIDQLVAHVETEMEVLRNLRSATITDAVLGRIDVRQHMKN